MLQVVVKVNFNSGFNYISYKNRQDVLYKDFLPVKTVFSNDVYVHQNILNVALSNLEGLEFLPEDVAKIKKLGIDLLFKNGKEAVNFAKKNNIPIIFDKVDSDDIHAQWINDKHLIVINERYKNTNNPAEVYAISAALIHELAHAKDNDSISSVQEELECLSMNALAFNVFKTKNPNLFKKNISPILDDGVALYANLFFSGDRNALIERIRLKYGNLPIESPNHKAGMFSRKIKHD